MPKKKIQSKKKTAVKKPSARTVKRSKPRVGRKTTTPSAMRTPLRQRRGLKHSWLARRRDKAWDPKRMGRFSRWLVRGRDLRGMGFWRRLCFWMFNWRYWIIFIPIFVALEQVHYSFYHSAVPEAREFTVGQGQGIASVARGLDLSRNQQLRFRVFVRLHGDIIKAGMYDLPAGASVWRIAKMMSEGDIASATIMIPEGLTVRQIVNLLNASNYLTGEITRIPDEGRLFPDTYIVAKGTSRQAVLDLMARRKMQIRNRFYDPENFSPPAPLRTWEEVIILASIVQKETSIKREMPKVASVFLNRLRVNMRLQADPTVVYTITDRLGDMQGRRLLLRHLEVNCRFNTYRFRGLPPTPIANVGIDAIRAVLNPADTEYFFFVADGTGGHNFSRTLAEHNRYVEIWREWRRVNNR